MTFDSDSPVARSPYSGRHRKEPSYLRAVRTIRLRRASGGHTGAITEPATPLTPTALTTQSPHLRLVRLPDEEQAG